MNKPIEALVCGFKDGGCEYVSNFPGFKSHDIFFGLGGDRISINERVAYEMAFGGSLAGKRSVVSFKGTGLNFAADAFLHTIISGVNAGMVLVLTDDIEAISSPERQDSRPYRDIFGGLWLEPTSISQAYDFAYHSFEWSEILDIPVVIRLTNQFFDLEGEYYRKEQLKNNKKLENRREKYVSYWKVRQDNLNKKNQNISIFVNSLYPDFQDNQTEGIVVLGNCQEETKGFSSDSFIQVFSYPLPEEKMKSYLKNKASVKVYEQGTPYGAEKIAKIHPSFRINSDTGSYKDASGTWKIFNEQEKLFTALKKISPSFVVGDEGTYTDESSKSIQVCLAMGTAIGITAGLSANGVDYPWCVIGDTAFNLTGFQAISEATERQLSFGIIVFDNGVAKSTGGQKIMGDIRNISKINKINMIYDEVDEIDILTQLKIMKNTEGVSILYIKI